MIIKKTIQYALIMMMSFMTYNSATATNDLPSNQKTMHTETDSFVVSGNCGMCKTKIEASVAELDGVLSASWNVETKVFRTHFDPHLVSITQIKQKIADAGYDTDTIKANETSYDGLPGCCKYDRE